jgi:DNA polymerase-3 subunit beta
MTAATFDLATFADALTWVAKAIPGKLLSPGLGGIRMLFDSNGTVTLSAFDYETSHVARVESLGIVDPGEVYVPGHMAAQMVGALRGDTVDVAPGGTDWGLTLKAGRSTFRLPEFPLSDAAKLPDPPPTVGAIDAGLLAGLGRTTSWAAGRDDMLPALTGVKLVGDDQALTAQTTNRFTISQRSVLWDNKGDGFTAIAPSRQLAAAVAGLTGRIEIGYDDRTLRLSTDAREVTTRCLDVEFPKLASLIRDPTDCPTQVVVDVADMVDALARARIALEANKPAQLTITDGSIEVTAFAEGGTGGAVDVIEATVTGPPIEIGFNPVFLSDGLKSVGTARVVLGFTAPGKPAYLAPERTTNPDAQPDVLGVVMPRRVLS